MFRNAEQRRSDRRKVHKTSSNGTVREQKKRRITHFETVPFDHSGTYPKTEHAPMVVGRRHLYIARSLAATGGSRDWAQRPH